MANPAGQQTTGQPPNPSDVVFGNAPPTTSQGGNQPNPSDVVFGGVPPPHDASDVEFGNAPTFHLETSNTPQGKAYAEGVSNPPNGGDVTSVVNPPSDLAVAGSRITHDSVWGQTHDALAPVAGAPIDTIFNMVDSLSAGHYKEALAHAFDVYSKLSPTNPDNPLVKTAYNVITSIPARVMNDVKDTYSADQKSGHGKVVSAIDAATGGSLHSDEQFQQQAQQDLHNDNRPAVLGDVVSNALESVPGATTAFGPAVQHVNEDLRNHNYAAVGADAFDAASNIAALLIPGAEEGEAANDAATAARTPNKLQRAVVTMREAHAAAAAAPSDMEKAKALQDAVHDAHAAAIEQVEKNFAGAHGSNEALRDSAILHVNDTFNNAHQQISDAYAATDADQRQALLNGQYLQQTSQEGADKLAASAPTEADTTASVKQNVEDANEQMKATYRQRRAQAQNLTQGISVPYDESPLAKAVNGEVGKVKGIGPLTKGTKTSLPGSPRANEILSNWGELAGEEAEGENEGKETAQVKMPDILDSYQQINENMRNLGFDSSVDRADFGIYQRLKRGLLDTAQQIAERSGNPEAMDIVRQMNSEYAAEAGLYNDPVVKSLTEGKLYDVDKKLISGQAGPKSIGALKQVLGDKGFQNFADNSLRRIFADSMDTTGKLDYNKAFTKLAGIPPEVREALYGQNGKNAVELLNNLKLGKQTAEDATKTLAESGKARDTELGVSEDTRQSATKGINAEFDENGKQIAADRDTKLGEINEAITKIIGNGDISDLMSDKTGRTQRLLNAVGQDGINKLRDMEIQSKVQEFSRTPSGAGFKHTNFDPEAFTNWFYNTIKDSPESAKIFFAPDGTTATRFDKYMADMQNAASVKSHVRNGVIRPILGAGAAVAGKHAFGPMEGMIGALLGFVPGADANKVLDIVANHPAMWKTLGFLGNVGEGIGKITRVPVGAVVKTTEAVAKPTRKALGTVAGKAALTGIYAGAQDSLGGKSR